MVHSQHALGLHDRAATARRRAAFTLAIGAAAWFVAPGVWPIAWIAVALASQYAAVAVAARLWRTPGPATLTGPHRLFLAVLLLSSTAYAAIAPYCWFLGGWGGRLFALMLLAGGALELALRARNWEPILWFGAGPNMLVMTALPLVSWAVEKDLPPAAMLTTAAGCALFALHVFAAGRRSVADADALANALQQAERDHQRAESVSAAKGEFLAVMSHEIRTPLNGVLGMAQAMAADRLNRAQTERLEALRHSGETLLGLVNDFFDLSELVADKLELEPGVVRPDALVGEARATFAPRAAAKGLAFTIELGEGAEAPRLGDPLRLRRLLHQLVDNAVKFTEAGEVRLTLRASAEALEFEVRDTGPGIAAERLPSIFERFAPVDGSATRRYGGSGVGLALARGLARIMGGDVTAASTAGGGATFTARLPLPLADDAVGAEGATATPPVEATEPARPPEHDPAESAAARVRILAAEDNPTNRLVLQMLLETVGLTAHMVENGREAVDAWRAAHWDLVLMDIQMPVMDGVTATRLIRQAERETGRPHTPIVALTANALSHQAAEYVCAGMDGLVPKPIEFSQLLAAIAHVGEPVRGEAIRAA